MNAKTPWALATMLACTSLPASLPLASADEKTLNITLGKEPDDLDPMSGIGHEEIWWNAEQWQKE